MSELEIDRLGYIDLPEGTVTFLFTDIEGSTKLLEQLGDVYATLLSDQRRILRESFSKWHGQEVDTQGDAFFVAFPRATEAMSSAVDIQRTLALHEWPGGVEVCLRMGLHTGEPMRAEGGYVGMDVHRAARIANIGHGRQVLLSETTTALVLDELPEGVELLDVGRHLLKDIRRPEHIHQLVIEGFPSEFPPLTSIEHLPPAELREPRQVGDCPYRGLAAFQEDDANFFYGRETFTERLLEAVRTQPMVAVIVGSSGSGKSSAVFAGLLPRLRGVEGWDTAVFRPGSQPFFGLGGALLSLLEPDLSQAEHLVETAKLSEAVSIGDLSLVQVVERILANSPGTERVLLVIDQFEELYTLCPDVDIQRNFLDTLLLAVITANSRRPSPLVLLLTMRADFMGQALTHRPFADALQEASLIMGPMNRDELRTAIEKPAGVQGAAFEPGLVERILDDVGFEPGNLPLLEFALTLLWDRQSDGWLTHEDYEALGCVQGALASYADDIYAGLDENERQAASRIFVQLIMPGEGTQDTRRVATCDELGEDNWALIQHLADKRLVVTGRDASSGYETVEVVHEALIQRWGILQDWMRADRAFRTWQERLRNSLRAWEASNRDQGALLRGAPLIEAEDWLQTRSDDLAEIEKTYIETSQASRRETHSRRDRRRRRIITGLAVGMIIALLLSILAGLQWRRAEDSSALAINRGATAEAASTLAIKEQGTAQAASTLAIQRADALATSRATTEEEARLVRLRELVRASLDHLDTDPQLSLLLALYAIDQSDLDNRSPLSQVEGALHRAVQSADARLLLSVDTPSYDIRYATFNAHGDRLVTWGTEPSEVEITKVYDAISGNLLARLPGRYAAQTSWPDDSRLVTLNQVPATNVELTYWDTYAGEVMTTTTFTLPGENLRIYDYWANRFDPSYTYFGLVYLGTETRMFSGSGGSGVAVLIVQDLNTDESKLYVEVEIPRRLENSLLLSFTNDGMQVLLGTLSNFYTWDIDDGEETTHLNLRDGLQAYDISLDGILIAFGFRNFVELWDKETQQVLATLRHEGNIFGIVFSPDGTLLATECSQNICIWDIHTSIMEGTGNLLYTLSGHKAQIIGFDFSPSGDKLVTGSLDKTIKVWDLTPGSGAEGLTFASESKQPDINLASIALSPDGPQLAVANGSEVPIVWDTINGGKLFSLSGHNAPVEHIAYSPEGVLIATGGQDGTVKLWDSETGELLLSLEGFSEGCCRLAFSPDGKSLAVGISGTFSKVQFFSLATMLDNSPGSVLSASGEEMSTLYAHKGPLSGLAFHPDGINLTTSGEEGQVELWDGKTAASINSIIPSGDIYTSIKYSKDGSLLAIGEGAGTVKLWDVHGQELLLTLTGHTDAVTAVAFDPGTQRMATASADGTTKIWDIEAGLELYTLYGHEGSVTDLVFSHDGKYLYTAGADGVVRTYIMDIDELIALGRERLTREFTEQECRQYLHLEQCPSQQY